MKPRSTHPAVTWYSRVVITVVSECLLTSELSEIPRPRKDIMLGVELLPNTSQFCSYLSPTWSTCYDPFYIGRKFSKMVRHVTVMKRWLVPHASYGNHDPHFPIFMNPAKDAVAPSIGQKDKL